MTQIRVYISSNHVFLREALTRVMGRATDLLVVGDQIQGADILTSIIRSECDVLLADTYIPGINADLINDLRLSSPNLNVVLLDRKPNECQFSKVPNGEIERLVSKEASVEEVIQAVRAAASERFFCFQEDSSSLDIIPNMK